MLTGFKLTVEYTQILVFRPEFENFDGLWDEEDVAQGFVWSEGFVSFGIPDHDGSIIIQIFLEENYDDIVTNSERAITVPFDINSDEVLIGTILDYNNVNIKNGAYSLTYIIYEDQEIEGIKYDFICKLFFNSSKKRSFKIIKKGTDMSASFVLKRYPHL